MKLHKILYIPLLLSSFLFFACGKKGEEPGAIPGMGEAPTTGVKIPSVSEEGIGLLGVPDKIPPQYPVTFEISDGSSKTLTFYDKDGNNIGQTQITPKSPVKIDDFKSDVWFIVGTSASEKNVTNDTIDFFHYVSYWDRQLKMDDTSRELARRLIELGVNFAQDKMTIPNDLRNRLQDQLKTNPTDSLNEDLLGYVDLLEKVKNPAVLVKVGRPYLKNPILEAHLEKFREDLKANFQEHITTSLNIQNALDTLIDYDSSKKMGMSPNQPYGDFEEPNRWIQNIELYDRLGKHPLFEAGRGPITYNVDSEVQKITISFIPEIKKIMNGQEQIVASLDLSKIAQNPKAHFAFYKWDQGQSPIEVSDSLYSIQIEGTCGLKFKVIDFDPVRSLYPDYPSYASSGTKELYFKFNLSAFKQYMMSEWGVSSGVFDLFDDPHADPGEDPGFIDVSGKEVYLQVTGGNYRLYKSSSAVAGLRVGGFYVLTDKKDAFGFITEAEVSPFSSGSFKDPWGDFYLTPQPDVSKNLNDVSFKLRKGVPVSLLNRNLLAQKGIDVDRLGDQDTMIIEFPVEYAGRGVGLKLMTKEYCDGVPDSYCGGVGEYWRGVYNSSQPAYGYQLKLMVKSLTDWKCVDCRVHDVMLGGGSPVSILDKVLKFGRDSQGIRGWPSFDTFYFSPVNWFNPYYEDKPNREGAYLSWWDPWVITKAPLPDREPPLFDQYKFYKELGIGDAAPVITSKNRFLNFPFSFISKSFAQDLQLPSVFSSPFDKNIIGREFNLAFSQDPLDEATRRELAEYWKDYIYSDDILWQKLKREVGDMDATFAPSADRPANSHQLLVDILFFGDPQEAAKEQVLLDKVSVYLDQTLNGWISMEA
ncbi:MAG: hypothetical protein HYY61_01645, partial [Deltaproteobacteria bacterium]|nr:hypothetical protein [Deltaproteobacteria bacterium]